MVTQSVDRQSIIEIQHKFVNSVEDLMFNSKEKKKRQNHVPGKMSSSYVQ